MNETVEQTAQTVSAPKINTVTGPSLSLKKLQKIDMERLVRKESLQSLRKAMRTIRQILNDPSNTPELRLEAIDRLAKLTDKVQSFKQAATAKPVQFSNSIARQA